MCKQIYIYIMSSFLLISSCGNNQSQSTTSTNIVTKFANISTISKIDIGYDTYNSAAVILNNNIFYTDRTLGLSFVDISNPLSLTKLNRIVDSYHSVANLNGYDSMYSLVMTGNIAVMAVNSACLGTCEGDAREIRLYDLSTKNKAIYLSTISIPADNMIADGNVLYITSHYQFSSDSYLYIVDISKPTAPVLISTTPIPNTGYLSKKDNIIYISYIIYYDSTIDKYKNILTVDITDEYKPILESTKLSTLLYAKYYQTIINGNIMYYLDSNGLNILDIKDRLNIELVKTITLSGEEATSFDIYDNKLFVAAGNLGVMVFDVSQPDNPIYLKSMKSNTAALSVKVSNGVGFYISDELNQVSGAGYSTIEGYKLNLFFDK